MLEFSQPPAPGELRAVCWDHNSCEGSGSCACTCHVPSSLKEPWSHEPPAARRSREAL
jgi:hypothetical protein